jgi:hypothetical protein
VRGPRRHLPYAAGPDAQFSHFFPFFCSASCSCCGQSRVLCRRAWWNRHCISLAPSIRLCVFLSCFSSFWGTVSAYLEPLILFRISIGHIIASETEEDVFRALGMSHHYSLHFSCDLRRLRARGVRACSGLHWGRWRLMLEIGRRLFVLFHQGLVQLTCHWYPLCRCSVGRAA